MIEKLLLALLIVEIINSISSILHFKIGIKNSTNSDKVNRFIAQWDEVVNNTRDWVKHEEDTRVDFYETMKTTLKAEVLAELKEAKND